VPGTEKSYFAILAIGEDAKGIVEAVTAVLTNDYRCNIETSHMIIVGGQFSTTLIASTSSVLAAADLEGSLVAAGRKSPHWRVYVSPIEPEAFHPFSPDPSHSITAVSHDRSGIIHEIARVLTENRVNITTLSSGCSEGDRSRCVVALDVALPPNMEELHLREALDRIPDLELVDIEALRRHPSERG
jgi:glycine cleavage system regulatory protein